MVGGKTYAWFKRNQERETRIAKSEYQKRQEKRFGVSRPERTNCAICGRVIVGKQIALDHDHESGLFRGWLCFKCNYLLGWFENTENTILKYLNATKV